WALCPLPANVPPPAELDCPGTYGIDLPEARLDLADPALQALWPVLYSTPDGTPLTPAQRSDLLAQGTPLSVGFSADSGGETLRGFAQVPLRQSPGMANPEMSSLEVDGVDLPADGSGILQAGKKVRLNPVGSGAVALNFSFFSTSGEIDSLRSATET